MNDAQRIFEAYRSIVKSEEEQMHRRLSWLGALQGFLFAALSFAWGKNHSLTLIISGLGLAVSVLIFTDVFAGSKALFNARVAWCKHKPSDYDGSDIFGLYPACPRFYHLFSSEVALPIVFAVAWILVMLIKEPSAAGKTAFDAKSTAQNAPANRTVALRSTHMEDSVVSSAPRARGPSVAELSPFLFNS
jgi:hypothetical protein